MNIEQTNINAFLTNLLTPIINEAIKANTLPAPPLHTSEPPAERFIDTKEVSELLGVSSVSVWQYEKNKVLQSYRIGNLKRFKLSEVLSSPKAIQRTKK
jgi:predicted DNA-binding transcriptional regulator AlpA